MDYVHGQPEANLEEATPLKEYKPPAEELDTEFKKEFPPDPVVGSEMDDAARVWKVYRKEAMAFDNTLLEGWSSTLDILLIFAGLFSAVATAFVIESYQLLQPDNSAYAAAALYILVAASNHSTGLTLPPPPDLSFSSPITRWINGLWFTSILLSLTVALLSILVKQWITEYRARNYASAKSPRDWARRHQLYSQALNAWPVAEVVSFLPVLLHLSLFLFFAGVVAFLWNLDDAIGIWIIILGSSLAVFYSACTLIPLWVPECPTSTPLVSQMRKIAVPITLLLLRVCVAALSFLLSLQQFISKYSCQAHRDRAVTPYDDADDLSLPIVAATPSEDPLDTEARLKQTIGRVEDMRRDKSAIQRNLERQHDNLDFSALYWLISDVPDSDAVAVGLQALGAIHPTSSLADRLRTHGELVDFPEISVYTRSSATRSQTEILRVARSALCMCRHGDSFSLYERLPGLSPMIGVDYPDLIMLTGGPVATRDRAAFFRLRSSSVTSTAVLLLRVESAGLNWYLGYLLCCDFSQVSDADWEVILQAMYAHEAITTHHPRLRSSNAFSRFRIADLLGHVALHSRDTSIRDAAAQLIPRLISISHASSLRKYQLPSSLPFLLDFMATKLFVDQMYEAEMIDGISLFLSSVVDDVVMDSMIAPRYWRALRSMGHIAQRATVYTNAFHNIWNACRQFITHSGAQLTMLTAIIANEPGAASSFTPSIWKIVAALHTEKLDYAYFFLMITDDLAAALGRFARRDWTKAAVLVDLYLAELNHTSIWSYLSSHHFWDTAKKSFHNAWGHDHTLHFIQHCIELRPQWWFDALNHVQREGSEDDRFMVLMIDAELSRRGPCLLCPPLDDDISTVLDGGASPLGWGDNTDQFNFSRCSFQP